MMKNKPGLSRIKRHRRIRMHLAGTALLPRLVIRRSLRNLFAQIIDDSADKTILTLSTGDSEVKQKFPQSGNVKVAEFFGEVFARRAKAKGVNRIVFDRAGYLYHGRVRAFAEALRKGGIAF